MTTTDKKLDLSGFTGSEQWFRHGLNRKVVYTEGVQYVAEKAGAYWLIDEIAINQLNPAIANEPFQVWKLEVLPNSKGAVSVEDGNGNKLNYKNELSFTDFPEPGITLWFTDNTILLPSEY